MDVYSVFENDLVYRDITKVNWCEQCKTILANEQVVAGKCERCGSDVVQKDMAQWMLRITKFADPLIDDLEKLNWDESIKQAQREWIGRKEGSLIPFEIQKNENLEVFTTRADTLFGVTYIVLAPEHKKIQEWREQITNWAEVESYVQSVAKNLNVIANKQRKKPEYAWRALLQLTLLQKNLLKYGLLITYLQDLEQEQLWQFPLTMREMRNLPLLTTYLFNLLSYRLREKSVIRALL